MDYESLQLTDEIKQYLEEMKYDRPQTALFLLGYLIGEVGNTQAKLTDSRTRPIINKINFEGMNPAKLIRLTNEVFEKLNQYRVFSKKEKTRVSLWFFNAGIFNAYKSIMDQEIKDWHLSDHENVFYVLSGYAYAAYKVWPKESINQDNEEVKENE